jgi:hypothetical protein
MNPSDHIRCKHFPCQDVSHDGYVIPDVVVNPQAVSIIMISEAAPPDSADYYYSGGGASYEDTTLEAFRETGLEINSFQEILDRGVYLTSAVKCAKTGYGIKTGTIKQCSLILENELALFQNIKVILLMGDASIKSLNYIAKRAGEKRVIPASSTYKIRGGEFYFREMRVFPSYLQVGPSFGIEKSKRRMIAEDIKRALEFL